MLNKLIYSHIEKINEKNCEFRDEKKNSEIISQLPISKDLHKNCQYVISSTV